LNERIVRLRCGPSSNVNTNTATTNKDNKLNEYTQVMRLVQHDDEKRISK
jgi:hypothetical protein